MADAKHEEEEFFEEAAQATQPSLLLGWIVLSAALVTAYGLGASLVRRGVEAVSRINVVSPATSLPKIRLEELGRQAEEKVEAKAQAIVEQAAETAAEKTVEKVKEEIKEGAAEGVKKTLGDKLKGF